MIYISIKKSTLNCILYIYYMIYFLENGYNIEISISFSNLINIITFIYNLKLDL